MDQKDIYRTAQELIRQHGEKARAVAEEKLRCFQEAEDVKAAGVWLHIGMAVRDLVVSANIIQH